MEKFEIEAKRLEDKIMGLFEKAMSSPEARFEVFESLGGVTLRRPLVTDPKQIARIASGYEILEGISEKVLDGKWKAVIEEDISGKCRVHIIDYVGRNPRVIRVRNCTSRYDYPEDRKNFSRWLNAPGPCQRSYRWLNRENGTLTIDILKKDGRRLCCNISRHELALARNWRDEVARAVKIVRRALHPQI